MLNGTSSSGKTSIAQAMQAAAGRPWFWVTTDHFWPMMPRQFDATDEIRLRVATSDAFLRTLLTLASAGWDVVADAVIINPAFWRICAERLAESSAHLVAVRCDVDELERRELARGDRTIGQARSQIDRVHAGIQYDFDVDTTTTSAEHCAREIAEYLATGATPRGFRLLRERNI